MNIIFEKVKENVGDFLVEQGFSACGGSGFIRKDKSKNREERIDLEYREGKGSEFQDTIYISAMCGIYYKNVNMLDKKIKNDFLNSYPLIAGSIKQFDEKESGYLSLEISSMSDVEKVSDEIIYYIKNGAFNLFDQYSDLKSILEAIDNNDSRFTDFNKHLNVRNAVRVSAIRLLVENKEESISWFTRNIPEEKEKKDLIETMQKVW